MVRSANFDIFNAGVGISVKVGSSAKPYEAWADNGRWYLNGRMFQSHRDGFETRLNWSC